MLTDIDLAAIAAASTPASLHILVATTNIGMPTLIGVSARPAKRLQELDHKAASLGGIVRWHIEATGRAWRIHDALVTQFGEDQLERPGYWLRAHFDDVVLAVKSQLITAHSHREAFCG